MERCPIAAQITGSIGILPCCVLNDLFKYGYEHLPRFVRPLSAAILFIGNSPRTHITAPSRTDFEAPTDDQKPEILLALVHGGRKTAFLHGTRTPA